MRDYEVAEKPVVPLSNWNSEGNSEEVFESCGMEFNKCYALYLYERPQYFLSATEPIDVNEDEPMEYGF